MFDECLISVDISQCSGTTMVCLERSSIHPGDNIIAWPSKVFFKDTIFSISLFPGNAYDQSLYCGPIDKTSSQPLATLKTWTVAKPSEDNSTYYTSVNLDSSDISSLTSNYPNGKFFFQIADSSKQVCLIGPYSWTGITINTQTTSTTMTTSSPTTTEEANSSSSDPLSNPAILGSVIAASIVAGLILCAFCIRCCFMNRRKEKDDPFGTSVLFSHH
jgi:hypothetical protein